MRSPVLLAPLLLGAHVALAAPPPPTKAAWPSLAEPPKAAAAKAPPGARDAAVVVAIEDYLAPSVPDVPGALQNGQDWYAWLAQARGVPVSRLKLLKSHEAIREEILAAAQEAAGQVQEGGTLWFVFVGHGAPAKDAQDGVLVGADAQQTVNALYARSLRKGELEQALRTKHKQVRTVLLLDACFSGRGSGTGEALAPGLQPMLPVAPVFLPGVTVLSAGTSNQFAGPLPGADRPAFSYLTLGALRGWGDADGDGEVSAQEALDYASQVLAVAPIGRSQTPVLSGDKRPLVLARGAREAAPRLGAVLGGEEPAEGEEAPVRPVVVDITECIGGDAAGCFEEGVAAHDGMGGKKDLARAIGYFSAACEGGEPRGCTGLGVLYGAGRGLPRDQKRAAELFQRSCDRGHQTGCNNLALAYEHAEGLPRDWPRAQKLYAAACDKGQHLACFNLALMHKFERGLPRDEARMSQLYRKGCEGGHAPACNNLGIQYSEGAGVARDEAQAATYYQRACEGGTAQGCTSLGIQFEHALGVAKDEGRAAALYERGCGGGDQGGCFYLASLNERGVGLAKNAARAATLYRRACEGQVAQACAALGGMYQRGDGVKADAARARQLRKQACELGLADACKP